MGLLDDAKDKLEEAKDKVEEFIHEHKDEANDSVEKAGDFVDEKTGGKYADKVDQAQSFAKEQVDKLDGPN
ncbi:antitoxin [Branchiibius sp. NY16-3462-2]|uniref:antitoxin n=1 Tax=Branchiibius sp. NY16-3462-2 TaxID=1807500 RepID=UPI0007915149|nr:antitoxin [Branchiibius sp. NY16-3462-2]KYH45509.1 hypothetical protein AZH51_00960 [Branchiibius sp. NY16-3462-2]